MRKRWTVSFAVRDGTPVLEVEEVETPRVLPPIAEAQYMEWLDLHRREFHKLWLTLGESDFDGEVFDGRLLGLNVMRDLIEMYADFCAL